MTHILLDAHWETGRGGGVWETEKSARNMLDELCQRYNFTVLHRVFHFFEPHGMTCVYVLSESHLSVHTWPEDDFVSIDLFCCRDLGQDVVHDILDYFQEKSGLVSMKSRVLHRVQARPPKSE